MSRATAPAPLSDRLGQALVAVLALEAVLFDQPAVLLVALAIALVEAFLPGIGPAALAARLLGTPDPRPRRVIALVEAGGLALALLLHLVGLEGAGRLLAVAVGLVALAAALRPDRRPRAGRP